MDGDDVTLPSSSGAVTNGETRRRAEKPLSSGVDWGGLASAPNVTARFLRLPFEVRLPSPGEEGKRVPPMVGGRRRMPLETLRRWGLDPPTHDVLPTASSGPPDSDPVRREDEADASEVLKGKGSAWEGSRPESEESMERPSCARSVESRECSEEGRRWWGEGTLAGDPLDGLKSAEQIRFEA